MAGTRQSAPARPLILPLTALVLGLSAADLFGYFAPVWGLPALLLPIFIAAFTRSGIPFALGIVLLFFVWGGVVVEPLLRPASGLERYSGDETFLIEGGVEGRPGRVVSGGTRLVLRVDRLYRAREPLPVAGKLLLVVKEGDVPYLEGDRLLFYSRLHKPRLYGIPGEFDYARYLAYRGISVTAFVKDSKELVLVEQGEGWNRSIDGLARRLGSFISDNTGKEEAGVLKALLLGETGEVSAELADAYARAGVNHILSISGFHIGIIFICVFRLLFGIGRCSETLAVRVNLKQAALLATLPVVVFYLFLSGAAPATLRSVIMIGCCAAAVALKREVDPINGIMVAAFAILAVTPEKLFDLSFQLSFLAIWGLALLAPAAEKLALGIKGMWRWAALLVAASVLAILVTAVPVAYYFHRISLIGILSNLIVVPLMGYGAVVFGFSSLLASIIAPPAAIPLLHLASWLVEVSNHAILYLARVPSVTTYHPGRTDLLLAYLFLCSLTFLTAPRLRHAVSAALLGALVGLGLARGGSESTGTLAVTFLSVGQGDAALVRLPDGKTMLVDGGGSFHEGDLRVGEKVLAPALWRLGVNRIDYLVLSHPHPDHLQGLLYIAAFFPVGEFWESGVSSEILRNETPRLSRTPGKLALTHVRPQEEGGPGADYRKLKWILAARGVPSRTLRGGQPAVSAGGVVAEPLWPLQENFGLENLNDSSLVIRLKYGRASVLFTGDVGAEPEEELVRSGARLHCSVLKVAHHGSRHSSSHRFLSAASPGTAVISAGYGNYFRLPAREMLARLGDQRIPVHRTDLEGSVEVVCRPDGSCQVAAPWGHFD